MDKILNCIDGQFTPARSGEWLENVTPLTGEVYSKLPKSDSRDTLAAIESARKAHPGWAALSAADRADWLRKIAAAIMDRLSELALAETIDNGKPIALSTSVDIPRSAKNFSFFADAITQYHQASYHGEDSLNYVVRKPLGVVGCISPWNLPLYLLTWKIAPALASGNTVVAKPSEVTPMTAFLLTQICEEIGLPKGVLNVVHGLGPDIGETLVTHPEVKAISFTGSTETGRKINQLAAPHFKKVSLEMGGKNPNILFADCDWQRALETTVRSSFSNQGQICLCGSRIYVERDIYEKFREEFLERVRAIRLGDPKDPATELGAIVSRDHYEKIRSYLLLAEQEGAQITKGEQALPNTGGFFLQPTVIEGAPIASQLNQEEIFGPVVTLSPFSGEEEVIDLANATRYGLAGSLWTQNVTRAVRMAQQIDSGLLWINGWMNRDLRTPFGGVKDSGVGREGGRFALDFFTEPQNVCIVH